MSRPADSVRVVRTRPVLVYDGDCAFCTTSVRYAERHIRPNCEVTPWQSADLASFGTTQQRAEHELLWFTPTDTVYGGAQAVARLLLSAGKGWAVLGALLVLPPVRWIAHGVYRLVANNRASMPGGTAACAVPADRTLPGGPRDSGHRSTGSRSGALEHGARRFLSPPSGESSSNSMDRLRRLKRR